MSRMSRTHHIIYIYDTYIESICLSSRLGTNWVYMRLGIMMLQITHLVFAKSSLPELPILMSSPLGCLFKAQKSPITMVGDVDATRCFAVRGCFGLDGGRV